MAKKYKLLKGAYHDLGPTTGEGPGCHHPKPRSYKAGDVIETDMNLLKFNGRRPMQPKFELVEDPPELEAAQAKIESLEAQLAKAK